MKLTKNEFKKLAKTAKGITKEERETTYENVNYVEENLVSYDEMLQLLKQCSRWNAEQYGNKILVSGTIYSFTVEL